MSQYEFPNRDKCRDLDCNEDHDHADWTPPHGIDRPTLPFGEETVADCLSRQERERGHLHHLMDATPSSGHSAAYRAFLHAREQQEARHGFELDAAISRAAA